MSRPLVVPLDGSPLAEHALPYAAGLARTLGTRLVLLHARRAAAVPESDAPDLEASAVRLRDTGVEVDTHIPEMQRAEDAGRTILQAATDLGAGAIVMATHGRGGVGRVLYGSVADQVLRESTLPVMVIPPLSERSWPEDRPLRVLVPLDGSENGEAILPPLQELLGPSGATLTLLRAAQSIDYVRPHGDSCDVCRRARARGEEPDIEPVRLQRYLDGVAERLRAGGLTADARVEIGGAVPAIGRVARERDVDLIAMATHGRGGVARLVLGSVATATLQQAAVPMLLVRPRALHEPRPRS